MSNVDEIKQRIDIVDLVSQYATLKRAGKAYNALCPFHTERTPSFHVDPARQTWRCFGACGTGGDIFSFIMKKEGCEFREALTMLAERAGVTIDQRRDTQDDARRSRLFDVNEAAAAYFAASLGAVEGPHASGAAKARAYVAERQLAPASIEVFQLGYAPNTWEALIGHLETRGFSAQDAVAAGVAVEGDRGAYDRFRHRLMFPIRDDRGRVAGFGGRLLPGDALGAGDGHQPKYVNTSQSAIFDKGAILYGLDRAKEAIRSEGRAVIVEGYMDVIAAHEHGFTNVVASMGTALTERQVRLLTRQTNTMVMALDEDDAGIEATLKSVYEIVNSNLDTRPVPNSRGVVRQELVSRVELRLLEKPEGKDPDEFIRKNPDAWPSLVDAALPLLDYVFAAAVRKNDISSPVGRSDVARTLLPWLSLTGDRIVQANYLQQLARLVQTDEATLRLEMKQPAQRLDASRAADDAPKPAPSGPRDKKEEFCLALLFRYPELLAEGMTLDADLFGYSENRALFETWVGWADGGESFEDLLAPDLRPQYERVLHIDLPLYDDEALFKALRSTVWGIEQRELRSAKRASGAVLSQMAYEGGENVAERARNAWERGASADDFDHDDSPRARTDPAGDDPAAAFVGDMEAGLKVHQRLLEQRRGAVRAPGEVVNDG